MWAASAAGALTIAVMAHAALTRIEAVPGNVVVKFVIPGLVCGLALSVWLIVFSNSVAIEFVASLLAYAGASELYLFLFTLVSSSISSQLLLRLASANTPITEAALFSGEEELVSDRVRKLVANDLLLAHGAGYTVTPRGKKLLNTFERLRQLLHHA